MIKTRVVDILNSSVLWLLEGKMNGAKNLPMRRTQNKIIILLLLFLAKSSHVDRLSNLLRHAVENSFWLLLLLLNVKLDDRVIGWLGDDVVAVVVVILFTLRRRR